MSTWNKWEGRATKQLMKELHAGQGIRLPEAVRVVGQVIGRQANGRPNTKRHVLNWIQEGVLAPGGKRLYLEAVLLPQCWATTAAAIRRFNAAWMAAAIAQQEKAERERLEARRATIYQDNNTPK
jgi:hypothetical protein